MGSQLKVIVKSADVRVVPTNNGKEIHKQQAALDLGGSFPLPFDLVVRPGRAYQPGNYLLDLNCIRNNRYGSLEIDGYGIALLPVPKADVKAA